MASGTLHLCRHSRRMFGLSPDAAGILEENEWADRLHPADLPAIRQALNACADHRTPYAERFRTIQPDGTLQFVFGVGRRIQGERGQASFVGWNFDLASAGDLAGEWISRHPEALAGEHLFSIHAERPADQDSVQAVPPGGLRERAEWILRARRSRVELFGTALMGESAFDLLLRLYLQPGQQETSLISLSKPSGIPYSSAMRWIAYLADKGIVERSPSDSDRRSTSVRLTPAGRSVMDELLAIR